MRVVRVATRHVLATTERVLDRVLALQLALKRERAVAAYLRTHAVRKLHLGCGPNDLAGWLNTDFDPRPAGQVHVDVTAPLPFADASWDYVFHEHLIEHLPFDGGLRLLEECRRVLRPGGKLRVASPDLGRLVALCETPRTPAQERYLAWAVGYGGLPAGQHATCFVLNNFMRAWGHRFVYDQPTLRAALERAGFASVRSASVGQSDDAHLARLEAHGRHIGSEEANGYETMVFEATRS